MNFRFLIIAALIGLASVQPAAADQVSITQDKAIAGGVSSGDSPGFPIQITDPGSYRLDSDLYPGNVPFGIYLSSPNVTLDFNGFQMSGGSQATDGIIVAQIGATIQNGTITHFRRYGIFSLFTPYLTVDSMKIQNIGGLQGSAIRCGRVCVVRDSTISGNNAGVDNFTTTFKEFGHGDIPLLIEGSTVAFNSDFQIRTGNALILGNVIAGEKPIDTPDPEITPPYYVGYGNNTILGGGPPTRATPLLPNLCNPAC